jgi:CTP synthase
MQQNTILFLGKYEGENATQAATRKAVLDAAAFHRTVLNTRWMGPDSLTLYPGMVAEAAGVILAPPQKRGPSALSESMLAALTVVRETGLPFLATGESHGLVFIEAARSLLGLANAGSAAFDAEVPDPIVHELPSVQGADGLHEVELELADDDLLGPLYADIDRVVEQTDIVSGLNPDYAARITDLGFRTAAKDRQGGRPYLHVLEGHPFHVTAAFLPQFCRDPGAPHPLFRGLVAACLAGR